MATPVHLTATVESAPAPALDAHDAYAEAGFTFSFPSEVSMPVMVHGRVDAEGNKEILSVTFDGFSPELSQQVYSRIPIKEDALLAAQMREEAERIEKEGV